MSPIKRAGGMRIALPPRLNLSMSQDSSPDTSPSTAPHTPLPYEFGFTPDLAAQHAKNGMHLDALDVGCSSPSSSSSIAAVGSKRAREEEPEEGPETEWTDEEVAAVQSALIHPYRPLSSPFPPGELPPPHILDELTNQILLFAFRPSPHKSHYHHPPQPEKSWPHTWDATRKRLFAHALAESDFGREERARHMPRQERQASRPGLRRMDSMDFLDGGEGEDDQEDEGKKAAGDRESVGRTLRLSTSLQNSAKQQPLLIPELDTALATTPDAASTTDPDTSPSSTTPSCGATAPSTTTITLTPSSPQPAPSLRRKGSFRAGQVRPARPTSLLQRGRSFTASDLAAEAASPPPPSEETSLVESPTTVDPPPLLSPTEPTSVLAAVPSSLRTSKMTRSQSSSALLQPANEKRQAFMSHQPASKDISLLAMPLPISKPKAKASGGGWSDSEDETGAGGAGGGGKQRVVKKLRGKKAGGSGGGDERGGGVGGPGLRGLVIPRGRGVMEGMMVGLDKGGLKSPFEEKAGMSF